MVHSSPTLPPLDTVEAFARAARAGSFSGAATSLGLTHGAVSRQVSRLERWMGVRLFDRAARGVTLTPEGSRFLARAEEALALLGGTHDRWMPRQGTAVVRLSITPSLTSLWLFPRLAEIEGSDLHLDLRLEHRLADFSDGIDLAVRCGRGPWAGVRSVQLWTEEVAPIAAPALVARLGKAPQPAMLLEQPILHDSNTEGWRLWFAGAGIRAGASVGQSDEWSWKAVEGVTTSYDFHATILHLLGLNHEQLTFRHSGIDRRLTDVHGRVIREILAG